MGSSWKSLNNWENVIESDYGTLVSSSRFASHEVSNSSTMGFSCDGILPSQNIEEKAMGPSNQGLKSLKPRAKYFFSVSS